MDRLFGRSKKDTNPPPTLSDTVKTVEGRVDSLDAKIRKLDGELLCYKEQLARLPPGSPARESIQRQALQILRQKRQYESQRQTLQGQSFNLEQTNFTVETLQTNQQTVQAMKLASREMRSQMKQLGKNGGIDAVEDLRDELEDQMLEANEINEVLARSYGTPDYLDEEDLEAELGALAEFQGIEEQPSYLNMDTGATETNATPIGLSAGRTTGGTKEGAEDQKNAEPSRW